jgi:hypothetical protein
MTPQRSPFCNASHDAKRPALLWNRIKKQHAPLANNAMACIQLNFNQNAVMQFNCLDCIPHSCMMQCHALVTCEDQTHSSLLIDERRPANPHTAYILQLSFRAIS